MSEALATSNGCSFRGLIGVAREDITPPVGIYARSWGAATHDVAEGIHRPLTLTCLALQSRPDDKPLVLMAADLGWWRSREDEWAVRQPILESLAIDPARLMICLSHTHSGPSLLRENSFRPGGELIEPYHAKLIECAIRVARRALTERQPATLTWRYGTCDLATNRDLREPGGGSRIVCGYNPDGAADDTLLIGRVCSDSGGIIATLVNYACHPTTLAWENKLISTDFVGATRDVVEANTHAPCMFLQGASGELAPAEQYSGDVTLADRHGRRLGFAALSTLEAMQAAGHRLAYRGVVESGAPLAVWREERTAVSTRLAAAMPTAELPLKPLPSLAELEQQWRDCEDPVLKERLWRKRGVRKVVGDGSTTVMPMLVWRVGDALLVGQSNETYSQFQLDLRQKFAPRAVAVMNLVNGSAGYLPPRKLYETDIYQVWQSPFAAGGLEIVTELAMKAIQSLMSE